MINHLCSIVIPCHNQGHFLGAAIRSAERQRDIEVEVIVVNDGSSDTTATVAAHASVRLIEQPNRGLACARNAGLQAARGPFVVFLDADDILLPDAAATGCGLLQANPAALLAWGRCRLIDVAGTPMTTRWARPVASDPYRALLRTNFIWTPGAAVMRRDAVIQAGGFIPRFSAAADYALYFRLARRGPLMSHDREVVLYRRHRANMSNDPVMMLQATLAVLKAERRHVPPELRHEFRIGRRAWQDQYGDQVADLLRYNLRQPGGIVRSASLAAVLLRYHPVGFFRHMHRKLALLMHRIGGFSSDYPRDGLHTRAATTPGSPPRRPGRWGGSGAARR